MFVPADLRLYSRVDPSPPLLRCEIASSVMYFIETDAQPEAFGSIPETLWWGVITLTTVGYGDVTPITPLGQFFGQSWLCLGLGCLRSQHQFLPLGLLRRLVLRRRPPSSSTAPAVGRISSSFGDGGWEFGEIYIPLHSLLLQFRGTIESAAEIGSRLVFEYVWRTVNTLRLISTAPGFYR